MRITTPDAKDVVKGREEALQELVQAVAARPLNPKALAQARKKLLDNPQNGEGTLVEAAVVVGMFEAMTKITDTTGKKPMTGLLWIFLRVVFAMFRFVYEKWMWLFGSACSK